MGTYSNKLVGESSPYLLQHAHNPVHWYPWGQEALQRAKEEGKPILVSIGYAACHWCHVMEKESFEDEATAAIMNRHFINIKIDREERPDLDHIYMDAVQAMTGSGGWPLNVFLTPDARPFFGGTYFPPQPAYNRNSWTQVLEQIATAFSERREELEKQANSLTLHLIQSNQFGINTKTHEAAVHFTPAAQEDLFHNLMKSADRSEGGFGKAPKFPQTFSIRWLLEYYYHTGERTALEQACLSLDKMILGGIYDQAGGGFARYSTDNEWLVPHFEKMLYDNALLVTAMCDAWQLTGKPVYRRAIEQTLSFVLREWVHPEGGFYAAYDADSEGVEGKYYVWTLAEIEAVLGEEAGWFASVFDVTEAGNWEGHTILNRREVPEACAQRLGWEPPLLEEKIAKALETLRIHRESRIRPLLDDKILLGWNALMITAFCRAYGALGREEYLDAALRNWTFLETHLCVNGLWHHNWKEGKASNPAFLDDGAWLIQALIHLQEVTGNELFLLKARDLMEHFQDQYRETDGGAYFFFTPANQQDVIVRKKEVYDGATPSGNAVMAQNLSYLGIVFNRTDWVQQSEQMLAGLAQAVIRYPGSFGVWASLLQAQTRGVPEIALVGPGPEALRSSFLRTFIPFRVFQSATRADNRFPLLSEKPATTEPQFYLCKHYSCQVPVNELDSLLAQLKNV